VKTYYLTAKFKILYAIMPILILVLLFKIFAPNYVCLGIYGIPILFISFKNITSAHVILSDNGIEYHRLGLTFNVKWENIEKIGIYYPIPYRLEGLFVDHSLIKLKEWWLGTFAIYGGWGRRAFIPLSSFSNNWRDSLLGQQMKQYAPELFEKEKSAQSA